MPYPSNFHTVENMVQINKENMWIDLYRRAYFCEYGYRMNVHKFCHLSYFLQRVTILSLKYTLQHSYPKNTVVYPLQ